jgi:hypothetical protein
MQLRYFRICGIMQITDCDTGGPHIDPKTGKPATLTAEQFGRQIANMMRVREKVDVFGYADLQRELARKEGEVAALDESLWKILCEELPRLDNRIFSLHAQSSPDVLAYLHTMRSASTVDPTLALVEARS